MGNKKTCDERCKGEIKSGIDTARAGLKKKKEEENEKKKEKKEKKEKKKEK